MENLKNLIKDYIEKQVELRKYQIADKSVIKIKEIVFNRIKNPINESFEQLANDSIYFEHANTEKLIRGYFNCRLLLGNSTDYIEINGIGEFNGKYDQENNNLIENTCFISLNKYL